jgi:hypothetical protein
VLLTAINWPGTQYVMDEMTKGLFGHGRKIGNHSAQKGQLDRSPINCPFEANFKMVQRSLALDRHSVCRENSNPDVMMATPADDLA